MQRTLDKACQKSSPTCAWEGLSLLRIPGPRHLNVHCTERAFIQFHSLQTTLLYQPQYDKGSDK